MATSEEDRAGFEAAGVMARQHWPGVCRAGVLLSKEKRQAVWAVLAMCHLVRQAAEAPETNELLELRLKEMAEGKLELPRCEFRSPEQHVLYSTSVVIRKYQLPVEAFLDVARERVTEMTVKRFATWPSLEKHCQQAMGSVAWLIVGVLGAQHTQAKERAIEMGVAIRLTSILRHVHREAAAGTVWLPLEDLVRFGYSDAEMEKGVVNEKFAELVKFEVERARELYRAGAEGIAWLAGVPEKLFAAAAVLGASGKLRAVMEKPSCSAMGTMPSPLPSFGAPGEGVRRGRGGTGNPLGFVWRMWKLARGRGDEPVPDVF